MKPPAARTTAIVGILLLSSISIAARGQGADFSRYVALGDSLTAGFTSGGLVEGMQRVSYPTLLDRQARGGAFELPLVSAPGIPPLLDLQSLVPLVITPLEGLGEPLNLLFPDPYNNLAVPGARVNDILDTVAGNPLYALILRGLGTQVEQALALQPSFVTLWAGNNDALAAAVSGVVVEGVTLTPTAAFEADYREILGALEASGAQLAVATIPDVTAVPFVSTIPPVVVDPATNEPALIDGQPVPLIGPDGPLTAADRVLLPASELLQQGIGIPTLLGGAGEPLPDAAVLSGDEVAAISARVEEFNAVIRNAAQEAGAVVVDIKALFDQVAEQGLVIGGIDYTADFLTGGLFSYDGIHPSAIGYALVANRFIMAINETLDADVPLVDLFPFVFEPDPSRAPVAVPVSQQVQAEIAGWVMASLRWSGIVPSSAELGGSGRERSGRTRRAMPVGQPPGD